MAASDANSLQQAAPKQQIVTAAVAPALASAVAPALASAVAPALASAVTLVVLVAAVAHASRN